LRGVLDDAARATARAKRFMSGARLGEYRGDERARRFDEAQHELLTNALRVRIRLGDGPTYQACRQVADSFAILGEDAGSEGSSNGRDVNFEAASEALAEAAMAVVGSRTSTP
jgi:hypothetical protein